MKIINLNLLLNLADLQIQNNGFYGNIPDVSISFYLSKFFTIVHTKYIFNTTSVEILDLSQNKFSSTIPTTLLYLTSLSKRIHYIQNLKF